MRRFFGIIILVLFSSANFAATSKVSLEEYISQWKEVAIDQMMKHGIPASITMAQGILESGYGNSRLAVKGNNHFGIKCHDWKGETILKDDDKKNECFRKYNAAWESFEDHSRFLTGRSRYAFLFELDMTDYKGWAKGLKKAGYATNPKYDKLLIDLIEKHDLDRLDKKSDMEIIDPKKDIIVRDKKDLIAKNDEKSIREKHAVHKVYVNKNRTRYIVANGNDTFYQISKEFGLNLKQLDRWNDFPRTKDLLKEGDIVYIMPKKNKSKADVTKVKIEENEELWEVSQQYGIKLKVLMELNNISSNEFEMNKGDIVFLK